MAGRTFIVGDERVTDGFEILPDTPGAITEFFNRSHDGVVDPWAMTWREAHRVHVPDYVEDEVSEENLSLLVARSRIYRVCPRCHGDGDAVEYVGLPPSPFVSKAGSRGSFPFCSNECLSSWHTIVHAWEHPT